MIRRRHTTRVWRGRPALESVRVIDGKEQGQDALATTQGVVAAVVGKGRRIMIANRLIVGLLIWMVIILGMWLPLLLLDNVLHLPAGLRLALSLGAAVSIGWLLWTNVIQPVLRPQSLAH